MPTKIIVTITNDIRADIFDTSLQALGNSILSDSLQNSVDTNNCKNKPNNQITKGTKAKP